MTRNHVLATVVNYDFSSNADDLKARLSPHFETLLIDSSSPTPPATVDIVIPNEHYTGQWNEAVRLALGRSRDWLLFVASDLQIPDPDLLASCVGEAMNNHRIGVYTASLQEGSRAAFPACLQRSTRKVRECFLVEGFFFLARTDILRLVHPVPVDTTRYGWGIDQLTCYYTYQMRRKVVVDDRVGIFHPASVHEISHSEAERQYLQYMPPDARRFLLRSKRRLIRRDRITRNWQRVRKAILRIILLSRAGKR